MLKEESQPVMVAAQKVSANRTKDGATGWEHSHERQTEVTTRDSTKEL